MARVDQGACPWGDPIPKCLIPVLWKGTLEGSGYLGIHSGDSGLQYSLWLDLLPDGQAADSHGFRFHGL